MLLTSRLTSPATLHLASKALLVAPRRALASVANANAIAGRSGPALIPRSIAGARHPRRAGMASSSAAAAADGGAAAAPPAAEAAPPAPVDWAALGLTPNPGEDVAVLGGGCFWCIETVFNKIRGCSSAISGYAGGHVERPTYEEVCRKGTGHAEVVAVYYDPKTIEYETLLRVFFAMHDPTTPNQQGNDVGPQYRSAIYTIGGAQHAAARRVMAEVAEAKAWGEDRPVVTELAPLAAGAGRFWPAERHHQRYFEHSPAAPYCQFVVAPKVSAMRKKFAHLWTQ